MKARMALALALVWYFTSGVAAPDRMTPVNITEGVYMLQHSRGSGNSAVVFTSEGVLVLDFAIDNADQIEAFGNKRARNV